MAKDTLTLALDGKVTLGDFNVALHEFTALVNDLTNEIAGGADIDWIIEDLQAGSALTTILGSYEDVLEVENVVNAYEEVGIALESGENIPFSRSIGRRANKIANILNGQVTAIRFHTADHDSFITQRIKKGQKPQPIKYSFGSVKGAVQTLSMRGHLRFTIWDEIFDKAVNCYLDEGQEETMRSVWGNDAIVSGKVGRQPDTGLPVVVREISDVQVIPRIDPDSYRQARGVIPWSVGQEKPEEVIRRLRNG